MTEKTQKRGHCPYCGRLQAVLASGLMSKHGYKVRGGWFDGICAGDRYAPMEVQRETTDAVVAQIRAEVAALHTLAEDLRAGRQHPERVRVRYSMRRDDPSNFIPYAEASEHQQKDARESAAREAEFRARCGADFADMLAALVDKVHGQPLREVKAPEGPAPILPGDKRIIGGRTVAADYVQGARVYFTNSAGRRFSMSTRAWRQRKPA